MRGMGRGDEAKPYTRRNRARSAHRRGASRVYLCATSSRLSEASSSSSCLLQVLSGRSRRQGPEMLLGFLLAVQFIALTVATSTSALIRPTDADNFTAHEPQVFCQVDGHALSDDEIRQCENAIAFLPIGSPIIRIFGPYELDRISRTPIISRSSHCVATVDLRYRDRREQSSWAEVKLEGFREIYVKCLLGKRQAGFARVGYYYGLELLVRCGSSNVGAGNRTGS